MSDFKFRNLYEVNQVYRILGEEGVSYENIDRTFKNMDEVNNYSLNINNKVNRNIRRCDIRREIERMLKEERVESSDIVWLDKKNIRLINFVWSIMNNIQRGVEYDCYFRRYDLTDINNAYKMTANCFDERVQDVTEWFIFGDIPKEDKLSILDKFKTCWEYTIDKKLPNKMITKAIDEKDKEKCEWYYSRIKNENDDKNKLLTANMDKDYYWSVINYFDCIFDKYEYENRLDKIKRAWSQREHKRGRNGVKDYSYSMSVDIDSMVTEMSKKLGIPKCKVVEISIKTEFDRFKNTTK